MVNFFDNIYKNTNDTHSNIPWATLNANIYLKDYLDNNEMVKNKKALVIGCGLGDDANELSLKGYEVDAIDISDHAISLAKKRFQDKNINFKVEDIFDLPKSMINSYDFIYEGLTIQSIHPQYRESLIKIIYSLNKSNGELLLYTNIQNDSDSFGGPPWPLYRKDLEIFNTIGYEILSKEELVENKPIAPIRYISLLKKA